MVLCNDESCASGYCEFQDVIIPRIRKKRSPCVKNVLLSGLSTKDVYNDSYLLW